MSGDKGLPTILIRIASYRDSELPKTVASALVRADHPERLRFAGVNQVCEKTKNQLDFYRGKSSFTLFQVDWRRSQGLGWARKLTDGMYRGEDFSLQIDSHTVFEDGWDESLIQQWNKLEDPKAVLTGYPPAYRYNDAGRVELANQSPNKPAIKGYENGGLPRFKGLPTDDFTSPVPFVAGGMQFGPGETCSELPQVAEVFTGDEVVQSLRLFTSGYNVYAVEHCPIYHLYIRHEHFTDVEYAQDNFEADPSLSQLFKSYFDRSVETAKSILDGTSPSLLGTSRTLADFHNRFPEALSGDKQLLDSTEGAL